MAQKKEVSDKVVIALLIAAVIVSVLGAYVVYDYSHSYESAPTGSTEDYATGSVVLTVVENPKNAEVNGNEDIK